MNTEREYLYLPLSSAIKSVGVKIHLFALISHFTSHSNDLFVELKIIDETYPAVGITVEFCAENPAKLPNVKSAHDIISLHHVTVKIVDGKYYCKYDNKYSSFALFEEGENGKLEPYQVSAKYTGTEQNTIYLKKLRYWSYTERRTYQDLTEQPLKLMKIDPFAIFDLICKVLHVSKSCNEEWILYVWDGTDVPPGLQWRKSVEMENSQVPLHFEEPNLPNDISCTFPCVGTVLRVFLKANSMAIRKLHDNIINNNSKVWVRVCNMTCTMHETSGIWKGILEPFGKINILSDEDKFVQDRVREFENRMVNPYGRFPWLCMPCSFNSITVTDYFPSIFCYSTLMDSLSNKQAPHEIKCIARVVDIHPYKIEKWRSPFDAHFEIRLTLEDPTARIHAYLAGQDAEKFFGDKSDEILKERMKKLLGLVEWETDEGSISMRDPPWAAFCLKLCYLHEGPSKCTKYMVVGTRISVLS
ncbi:hypothetical protein LUZ60_005074 [Juncus effusus]|nr:hypothetical protein LUZ60_005074 [Juncus effusus]